LQIYEISINGKFVQAILRIYGRGTATCRELDFILLRLAQDLYKLINQERK
jgi:hypothetical protein